MVFLQFFTIAYLAGTIFFFINRIKERSLKIKFAIAATCGLSILATTLILAQVPWPTTNPFFTFVVPVSLSCGGIFIASFIIGTRLYRSEFISKYYIVYAALFILTLAVVTFIFMMLLTAFYPGS